MIEWENVSTRRQGELEQPKRVFYYRIGLMNISLHKHLHYGDTWLCSCNQLNIDKHELKSKDLEEAQKEALTVVKKELQTYVNILDLLNKEIGKND